MDYWYIIIIFIVPVLGVIWWLFSSAMVKAPGNSLQNKFLTLTKNSNGVIKGKTLKEVKDACGEPSAVSSLGNGKTLYQWQATGYHIALIFNEENICEGISSEIKV